MKETCSSFCHPDEPCAITADGKCDANSDSRSAPCSLKDSCEGAIKEFTAGKVMIPKSDEDRVWNDAHDRCIRILSRYAKGEGLFQL
jgi:hypothetical protein